jgi:hypothetical protein
MEMINLLEENPKTATVIKQWLLERLLESMKDSSVPEEFKQLAREQGIDNDRVAGILNNTPRALFDVFDSHKLYIQISGDQHGWSWEVDSSVENAVCSSRKEADTAAIVEAFKLLEAKL